MLIGFHFGTCSHGVGDRVGDQPHARAGREGVGPAAEVLLEDVVLGRALELLRGRALLLGGDDVERQQPGGGGVDRHRGVHLIERDPLHQRPHVAEVGDRDADLADLAAGELVVGVIAGLGRQVEGHRQAGLALLQVAAVELVGAPGIGVAGVGAHHPGAVALGQAGRGGVLRHGSHSTVAGRFRPGRRRVRARGPDGRRGPFADRRRARYREGMPEESKAAEEHALLAQITEPLAALPQCAGAGRPEPDFPVVLRGYDRLAVDAYVRQPEELIRAPRRPLPRRSRCGARSSGSGSRSPASSSAPTRPRRRSRRCRAGRPRTG